MRRTGKFNFRVRLRAAMLHREESLRKRRMPVRPRVIYCRLITKPDGVCTPATLPTIGTSPVPSPLGIVRLI